MRLPMPALHHHKDTLANGLRVVTVELPHLHTAALVVYAKVGSRYETAADNGLSHFLEHMLFRGTARHPSSYAINLAIEELGGTLYAETGRDYSLYQMSLDPELMDRGVALYGDIFGAPAFTDIDLERQIVLEELNEDLDEKGRDINLDDLARAAAFPGHPLGQKITGPRANVEGFDEGDLHRHFARFYGARNLILTVAGPVRRAEVLAAAEAAFAGLPAGETIVPAPPPPFSSGPTYLYVDNPGAQTAFQLLIRALPESHPDYVATQALCRVLDDGMTTRLHYTLCDQLGLAYYVNGSLEPFHDTALLELDGASAHAKLPELLARALGLLGEFRERPVSEAELAKAKRRYRLDLRAAIDDVDAMAGWFGGTELFYVPVEFEQKAARMEAVTAEDIQRVARTVITPERAVVGVAGALSASLRREAEKVVSNWR
jgi:predicted Zn-dependent peptidase